MFVGFCRRRVPREHTKGVLEGLDGVSATVGGIGDAISICFCGVGINRRCCMECLLRAGYDPGVSVELGVLACGTTIRGLCGLVLGRVHSGL